MGDGLDAPGRHRSARVRVLASLEGGVHGRRYHHRLRTSPRPASRRTARMPRAPSCSASGSAPRPPAGVLRRPAALCRGDGDLQWGASLGPRTDQDKLRHAVRLIPPARQAVRGSGRRTTRLTRKAICEAAQRPTMRFVAVKSAEQQAVGVVFRARDLLVRRNGLRSSTPSGGTSRKATEPSRRRVCYVERLVAMIEDADSQLPAAAARRA